jgi:hypothetical protein
MKLLRKQRLQTAGQSLDDQDFKKKNGKCKK